MDATELNNFINKISLTGPGGRDKIKKTLKELLTDKYDPVEILIPIIEQLLATKQDVLVSGQTIRTVNNHSLLGAGNLSIPKGEDGAPGAPGPQGPQGPVGVNDVLVSVDATSGTPSVIVTFENSILELAFSGLKGIQGNPGVSNPEQLVVGSLPEPSAQTSEKVYLVESDTPNEYNRYVSQYNGESYGWLCIGNTSMSLSDYIRKDDVVWLTAQEYDALLIKDSTKIYVIYEEEENE